MTDTPQERVMELSPNNTEITSMAVYTKHDDSPLMAADRCDSCGGQAYGQAVVNGTELLFCGHHLNKHLDRLLLVAESVDDFTGALQQTGMTSANAL